jgi:D-lactate dehydrogenase
LNKEAIVDEKIKIAVYSYRSMDEGIYFKQFEKKYPVELVLCPDDPTVENAHLAQGCFGVSIVTKPIDRKLLQAWKDAGVKHLSTRTIGFDHIDIQAAAQVGMPVSNITYSTGSVADYTVMIMLMALRKMKMIMKRAEGMDYGLVDSIGREIGTLTVGVIGTGRIGTHVIQNLSGFGCRILAYDPYENNTVKQYGEYAPLERIWKECDVITLHIPANPDAYHMINEATIAQMKDNVVIVNTARGMLIDTDALIAALEQGKVGAAALDVVEKELGIFYADYKYKAIGHHAMSILKDMPNVLMLPHMAFYTEQAVSDMVEHSIANIVTEAQGTPCSWRVY